MPSTMLSSRATLAPSAGICGSASGRLGSRNAHVLSHRASSSSLRARRSSPVAARAVMEISEANFEEEVLKSSQPVLVDYWATWCGPCKLVAPLMDWVEKEYPDLKVVKIETDPNPALVEKYKVYGLPTLMLFKDGEKVEGSHNEGAIGKKSLAQYLEQNGVEANASA